MTEEAINPLRRRMIEDMTVRNLDASTQRGYLRAVRSCSRYCGRRPEQLTFEDVRRFQLHLTSAAWRRPASTASWSGCGSSSE
jgi:integrase/recombinase XerD